MTNVSKGNKAPIVLNKATDEQIAGEFFKRNKSGAAQGILPYHSIIRSTTLDEWRMAVAAAENRHTQQRWHYYNVVDNATLDLHLSSIMETRSLKLKGVKIQLKDAQGNEDTEATKLLKTQWFSNFIQHSIDHLFYGFSLVEITELGEKTSIKTNTGSYSFFPIKKIELINRQHVRPECEEWLINPFDLSGYKYTDKAVENIYIPIGHKRDLGLLKKSVPICLAIRFALGAWQDYDEKLGVPFRYVKMKGRDARREKMLGDIMAKMGPAGWAVLHEGEDVQLMQAAGTDVHKCFMELIELLDNRNSKLILGSTMTVDAQGGNYKGEVHQDTVDIRFNADRRMLEYIVNDLLIPRLIKLGYPLIGYTFEIEEKQELSIEDTLKLIEMLLNHYNVDAGYIATRFNLPEDAITEKIKEAINNNPIDEKKKLKQIQNQLREDIKVTMNSCDNLYFGKKQNYTPTNSGGYKNINELLKAIYDGTITTAELDENLFRFTLDELKTAASNGLNLNLDNIDYTSVDSAVVANIKKNVYIFSAAKTHEQLRAMTNLILDTDGNIKPFSVFKKEAKAIAEIFNTRYLEAEYDHAVISSQIASKFGQAWKERDVLPYLQYDTIGDGRTTPICSPLEGVIRRVDDDFWNTHTPPLHWGCRSSIKQLASGEVTDLNTVKLPEIKPIFRTNPYKTATLFPENHPYFNVNKAQLNKIKDFAEAQQNKDEGK